MNAPVDRILYTLFLLLVLASPLPLGSNREWSWSLCAIYAGMLALFWVTFNFATKTPINTRLPVFTPALFFLACTWAVLQTVGWTPVGWHHPLWPMTAEVLGLDLHGRISLAAEDTWTALMRLLSYALVFFLAIQLGRDRRRAQAIFGWLALGGVCYAMFGLWEYWGDYHPAWLFGEKALAQDVRSTFINRNHFATWQGLTLLCAMAWFYHRMAKPEVRPYSMPTDRETQAVEFILKAWKPMTALLLMVTALVLTHSRGGFIATLSGTIVLMMLLDQRVTTSKVLSRVIVITALAVAGIAFYLTSELLLDRINRTDITSEERLAVYGNINRAIGDNPMLGFGYGTFADSYLLYDQNEKAVRYDRAHNSWLENAFELGVPAALVLYLALGGLVVTCWRGVWRRHRDWVYPATGVAASVLVGVHALLDFSLQLPAVAILYACMMGVACAQSYSSVNRA